MYIVIHVFVSLRAAMQTLTTQNDNIITTHKSKNNDIHDNRWKLLKYEQKMCACVCVVAKASNESKPTANKRPSTESAFVFIFC